MFRLQALAWPWPGQGNVSINSMAAHPPPGRLSGICHFGEKMLQMPHHGVQIMQQNPHPWGLTLTQMPHPWGQNSVATRSEISLFVVKSVRA